MKQGDSRTTVAAFWRRIRGLVLLGVLLLVLKGWYVWDRKATLGPAGGLYFPWKIQVAAPPFAQADPRWGQERLGPTDRSIGAEGCALTSAAMALAFYGADVDPQRLNQFLLQNRGFTERGWIYWEAAAEYEPGRVFHAYEDLPSYRLMDWNLLRKNPVIVRIRRPEGGTHFVLVVGKEGYEYWAQDPGAGGRLVRLSELASPVEALRFYQRLK
jgi:hypothetical protein